MGEITDVRDGTHASPHYVNSGFPLLTSKNISNGCINYHEVNYISEYDFHQINERSKVDVNDILMGMIGTIGNLALVQEKPNFAIKNVALIKNTGSIDYRFLFQNLQTDYIERELSDNMDGGTQKFISLKKIRNLSITFPTLLNEQDKIGNLFHFLDSTITLHEEKKCQLERLKSALLQKLFADENGNPAVRFKGFSEAWESRKLFDVIVKIIDFRGRTPKKMGLNWSERGHLALSALNVKDGFIDFSTDAHYANEILYKKWMSGNELLKGQVLFTTEAPMGNVAQVPDDSGYVLSQRTISFVSNNSEITDNFLAVVLRSSKVQRALSTLASGGTAKGVSQSTLSQLIMVIPISLDEQQKIERIIRIVEELTRLYQNKLEILTELKKSLLQKMFI